MKLQNFSFKLSSLKCMLSICLIISLACPMMAQADWQQVGSVGFTTGAALNSVSLAFDSNNSPYVAYTDGANSNKASVMKFNGISWIQVGSVGFSASDADSPSLAIDSNNTPYVAYGEGWTYGRKASVMKFDGTSWVQVGNVGFSAGVSPCTRLALDSNNTPYVAYMDAAYNSQVSVMKFNGTSWVQVGNVGFSESTLTLVKGLSLAINKSNIPYVIYSDNVTKKANVMKFDGTSWGHVGNAGFSVGQQATYNQIAFDSSNTPYVAYSDWNGSIGKANVMKFNGISWVQVGNPDFSPGQATNISLAIDRNNTPYVVYTDGINNSYKASAMKFDGTSWVQVGNPEFSAGGASNISLVFDSSNIPYVAYYDEANGGKASVMRFVSTGSRTLSFSAGTDGTITGATPQTVANGGSSTTVTAVPNAGYQFVNWTGTGGFATTTANPLTVSNVTADMTITANFQTVPTRIIGLSGSLVFGNVNVGSTKQLTFNISNTGNSALTVSSITYPAGFTGNWSSGTIPAGGSQSVIITFAPTAAQSYSGTVTVNSDKTSGTNTIAISGTGQQNYTVTFQAGTGGTISPAAAAQTVASGGSTTAVTATANSGYTFSKWTNQSGSVVSTSATLPAQIITSAMTYTANFQPAVTRIIGLTGSLAFGNINTGTTTTKTLTISNTGNSPLAVSSITYPTGFSGNWSGTIAAGASQSVTVTFAPTAAQSYSGTVTVNSDKTSGTNTIAISGTGTPTPTRIINLTGSLAFGNVNVGSTKQLTFTIGNSGNSTLTVSSITYPAGFTGSWSSGTIAASGSKIVTVTFKPTAAQSYSGTVTVNSDKTSGTNTLAISGKGVAVTKIIGLSGSLAFGNVTVNTTKQLTFTIGNTGNTALTVSSVTYPTGFTGSWSSGTIAAGGSKSVTVTFKPTAVQTYSGTVTVTDLEPPAAIVPLLQLPVKPVG